MQKGFSLLEVLITLAIISIGLFGLADAQLQAFRETQINALYNTLNLQVISLQEELQTTQQPQITINQWQSQLKLLIPDIKITTSPASENLINLTLQWQKYNENYQLQQIITLPARL